MSDLKKKYNEILKNLEDNIENPKDLEYATKQFKKLASVFLDEMEEREKYTENHLKELAKKQEIADAKLLEIEKTLNGIEKDIYDMDDDGYDLEIVCPYCNYEFVLDEDTESSEIECPECGNTIEIDWDGETFAEGCSGHCSGCGFDCENKETPDEDDDM
ncbi:MAG: hypothetical protein IJ223_00180 [Clostridia bacterium]|nr:hypothetical protein [Clostridia bacterium]